MKFIIGYKVGSAYREKEFYAENLIEAEKIADAKYPNWEDITMIDKSKGETANESIEIS